MKEWEEDKAWADTKTELIQAALGKTFFKVATSTEDQLHNTDLQIMTIDGGKGRVACRVRQYKYWINYSDEFTMRASRPAGTKTELDKVIDEGWGHFFFYGFASEDDCELCCWRVASLDVFRSWWKFSLDKNGIAPGRLRKNRDDSSDFRVFKWDELPDEFVVNQENAHRFLRNCAIPKSVFLCSEVGCQKVAHPTRVKFLGMCMECFDAHCLRIYERKKPGAQADVSGIPTRQIERQGWPADEPFPSPDPLVANCAHCGARFFKTYLPPDETVCPNCIFEGRVEP